MSQKLSAYLDGRENNFNLIRFIAASFVLVSHSFVLVHGTSDADPVKDLLGLTFGTIAVDIFFITSGFLITCSFLRNKVLNFIWARFLRIYPALITAMIFCVFIVGFLFTTLNKIEYLKNPQIYKFFLRNSTLLFDIEYTLPGVFGSLPYADKINGSLWTLPYEVLMYALIGIIISIIQKIQTRLKWITLKKSILFITALLLLFRIGDSFLFHVKYIQLLRLSSMFLYGSTFYFYKDKITLSPIVFSSQIVVLLVSLVNQHIFFIMYCITLPYIIFYLSYVPSGKIRSFNKIGDYSYGLYIYSFPIQQIIVTLLPYVSVFIMFLLSFIGSTILALLSWSFVEKKALSYRKCISDQFIKENISSIRNRFFAKSL